MQERSDCDLLTWTLAAVAVVIMATAVRINSGEPKSELPATPGGAAQELDRMPGRA